MAYYIARSMYSVVVSDGQCNEYHVDTYWNVPCFYLLHYAMQAEWEYTHQLSVIMLQHSWRRYPKQRPIHAFNNNLQKCFIPILAVLCHACLRLPNALIFQTFICPEEKFGKSTKIFGISVIIICWWKLQNYIHKVTHKRVHWSCEITCKS